MPIFNSEYKSFSTWQPKYTPNEHTLLYMPFTEDMLDHSGNNRSVSSDTGRIKNWCYFNDTADKSKQWFTVENMPALWDFTTTYIEKKTGTYASQNQASFLYAWWNQIHTVDFVTRFRFWIWWWDNDPRTPSNWADVWRLLTFVVSWNTFNFYINWSLISSASRSHSQPAWNHYYLWYWGNAYLPLMWYVAELVQEDVARTAQQVSDYYNNLIQYFPNTFPSS